MAVNKKPGAPRDASGSEKWWIVGGLAVVGLMGIAQCSSKQSAVALNTTEIVSNEVVENVIAASPAASPTPAVPSVLDVKSVARAGKTFQAVQAGEGFPGAMIFSQNCYAALSAEFSWAKLDSCGGFDASAVLAMDQDSGDAGTNELAYFGPEAAAGRYLAAVTAAGETADNADLRWSALSAKAVRPRVVPEVEAEPQSESDGLMLNDIGNISGEDE